MTYVFKARYMLKHLLNGVFKVINGFGKFCQTASVHKIKQKNPLQGRGEIKWNRAWATR